MCLVRLRTTVGMRILKVPLSLHTLQLLQRSTQGAVSGPTATRTRGLQISGHSDPDLNGHIFSTAGPGCPQEVICDTDAAWLQSRQLKASASEPHNRYAPAGLFERLNLQEELKCY